MSYAALKLPEAEFDDDSDAGSIQKSPELDTGAQFVSQNDSSIYTAGDSSVDTPFQAEHDSFQEGLPQHSPYHDSPGQTIESFTSYEPHASTANNTVQTLAAPSYPTQAYSGDAYRATYGDESYETNAYGAAKYGADANSASANPVNERLNENSLSNNILPSLEYANGEYTNGSVQNQHTSDTYLPAEARRTPQQSPRSVRSLHSSPGTTSSVGGSPKPLLNKSVLNKSVLKSVHEGGTFEDVELPPPVAQPLKFDSRTYRRKSFPIATTAEQSAETSNGTAGQSIKTANGNSNGTSNGNSNGHSNANSNASNNGHSNGTSNANSNSNGHSNGHKGGNIKDSEAELVDDDPLPFQSTTKMAVEKRPQSMSGLTHVTGPVMSSATFENYRKSISSLQMLQKAAKSPHKDGDDGFDSDIDGQHSDLDSLGENGLDDDEHTDDIDDDEPANIKEQRRQTARMRQEQDARMSIYRQKMKKVVGGGSPIMPDRRSILLDETYDTSFRSNQANGAEAGENEILDDIPISILQAHGFPKSRSHSNLNNRMSVSSDGGLSGLSAAERSNRASTMTTLSTRPLSIASSRMLNQSPQLKSSGTPPLPAIFGSKKNLTSRGLVGEISREEDLKRRRQTFGYTNVPSPTTHQNPELLEMQTKLDHVIQMLSTMSPVTSQFGPGSIPPQSLYAPSVTNLSVTGVSPSIKRASGDSWQSLPSDAYQRAQSIRSQSPSHIHGHVPSSASPHYPSQFPSPFPPQFSPQFAAQANAWNPSMGPPPMPPIPPVPSHHLARGALPPQRMSNRPSRMRLVQAEDDDEDEDNAWEEILERRRLLKDQWTNAEVTST